MRWYCHQNTCNREYKLVAATSQIFAEKVVNLQIMYKGDLIHDDVKSKPMPIKGERQKSFRKESKTKSATVFRDDHFPDETLTNERALEGNETYHVSKDNARKIKSKALQEDDLEKDDIQDVIAWHKKEKEDKKEFIQTISISPFGVLLLDPDFMKVLQVLRELGRVIGFIDATGGLCRRPFKDCPAILLHALIVYLPSLSNTPGDYYMLGGLLTASQTQSSIGMLLNSISMKSYKYLPVLDDIVSDNSWANLNAACVTLNSMTFQQYLSMAYEVWFSENVYGKVTLIHLCTVHLIKQFKNDLGKHNFASSVKYNLLRIFCCLCLTRTIDIYEELLQLIFTMLVCPDENNDDFKNALAKLDDFCLNKDDMLHQRTENDEKMKREISAKNDLDSQEEEVLYKNSLFYSNSKRLLDEVTLNFESSEAATNQYFNPSFAEVFCQKYLAVAPLFINIKHPIEVSCFSIILFLSF